MRLSETIVPSDRLKKLSNLIESVTYQENSSIYKHELLRRYGSGSKQSFIKVPQSKSDYKREDVLIPEEREIMVNKSLSLRLIKDLKSSGDIIRNLTTIFESKVETEEGIDNENFYLGKYAINTLVSTLLPLFCLNVEESGCNITMCCEIENDSQSSIVTEEYKTITIEKESDILQIMKTSSSTFTRSKNFKLSKDDIIEECEIDLSRNTFKSFRSKNGLIYARCPVEDLKKESISFLDNNTSRIKTACGIITQVFGNEVIGCKKFHLEELLSYKDATCTVAFVSSDNFTKILEGIKNQKNYDGEHLLIESIEDKNEENVSEDTTEFVEDQDDLVVDLADHTRCISAGDL